jgi:hypothetical protein
MSGLELWIAYLVVGEKQGGRAGQNGQQTTGPHAPTANPAVLTASVPASGAAGVLPQVSRQVSAGGGHREDRLAARGRPGILKTDEHPLLRQVC